MNVSELFSLTSWINREIQVAQIPGKYQALWNILQQNTNPNQHKQPFEEQKNSLIETLKNVPLGQLTRDQLNYLNLLGIGDAVGEIGVELIEQILYKNVIDVATSAQKVQEIFNKINLGIDKSNLIRSGLTDCVIEDVFESENEILMRISFTGNALMSNVADFKNWGSIWYDIGRGIAMAHNLSPQEVRIVGATKGSVVLELAVIAPIAATTSGIILAALKVAEKVLDIRKKVEELRGLKLKNEQLLLELEKVAEDEKKTGVQEITNDIVLKLNIQTNGEGDKVKALDTAVKNLVNFIEKGGVVDFMIPDEENEPKEGSVKNSEDLRVAFQQIRQLEKKLNLLEYSNPMV